MVQQGEAGYCLDRIWAEISREIGRWFRAALKLPASSLFELDLESIWLNAEREPGVQERKDL